MKIKSEFFTELEHIILKHFDYKYVSQKKLMNSHPDTILIELQIQKEWLEDIFKHSKQEYIHLDDFIQAYFKAFKLDDLRDMPNFNELFSKVNH